MQITMKKLILVLTCLIPLITFAAPKSKTPALDYETEYQISRTVLNYCIRTFIADLDDGISDASTVAKAARESCKKDFETTMINLCKSRNWGNCNSRGYLNDLFKNESMLYKAFVIPVLEERKLKETNKP